MAHVTVLQYVDNTLPPICMVPTLTYYSKSHNPHIGIQVPTCYHKVLWLNFLVCYTLLFVEVEHVPYDMLNKIPGLGSDGNEASIDLDINEKGDHHMG